MFDVILYYAKNNLALRDTDKQFEKHNCGIFLSTFELLSYYNQILEKHIEKLKSKKKCYYLFFSSNLKQNNFAS